METTDKNLKKGAGRFNPHAVIEEIGEAQKRDVPVFNIGDTVKVSVRILDEKAKDAKKEQKERIQIFEGIVIARGGRGHAKSFKVRRVSYGIGVERTFPLYSPFIADVKIVRHGKVRRAKLFYLRDRVGKAAQVKERKF